MTQPSDMEARLAAAKLWNEWNELDNRLEDARLLDESQITQAGYDAIEKQEREAWDAYAGQPLRVLDDGIGGIEKCALTGTPLLVDDELDYVLRSAVPGADEQEGEAKHEMAGVAG